MTESNGPTFRGRLLVVEHLRANIGRGDRVYVRYSTFDRDVAVNQVLAAALLALLDHSLVGSTRSRLDEVSYAFADLSPVRIQPGFFERLSLGRSTARYLPALTLARLILERQSPSLRAGGSPVFAMMFDMNILWEMYVAAMFRRAAGACFDVQTQTRTVFWTAKGKHTAVVCPDIVVRRRGEKAPVLICDTKWKVLGSKPPHDDHLKQMFVYNELLGCSHAVLLHPRCGPEDGMSGTFAVGGRRCSTAMLGLFEAGRLRHAGMAVEVAELLARSGAAAIDPLGLNQ